MKCRLNEFKVVVLLLSVFYIISKVIKSIALPKLKKVKKISIIIIIIGCIQHIIGKLLL